VGGPSLATIIIVANTAAIAANDKMLPPSRIA
jgi:hypothetical protein